MSPFKPHRMHRSAWQWCGDFASRHKADPEVNPVGKDASPARRIRGGSWFIGPVRCRSANRVNDAAITAASLHGDSLAMAFARSHPQLFHGLTLVEQDQSEFQHPLAPAVAGVFRLHQLASRAANPLAQLVIMP